MKLRMMAIAACLFSLVATNASAGDRELVPDKVESKGKGEGWKTSLSVGATVAFAHSSKVVGSADGQTWNIGPTIDFGFGYYGKEHEWRNKLGIREVFTRTPVIDEFVKTVDSLTFESVYLYRIPSVPWLGPFARFALDTAIFPLTDVRASAVDYALPNGDIVNADRLDLTDAFAPLKLKQSVGLFAVPHDEEAFRVDFRLGVGAREVFVQDGLAIADDDGTPEIEIKQLEDYVQAGGEIFAGISGTVVWEELGKSRPLIYSLGAEALFPFYSSLDSDKSGLELTAVEVEAKLGIKLFTWMSLDYGVKVVREPLLVDDLQIQNNLLLNFSYSLL